MKTLIRWCGTIHILLVCTGIAWSSGSNAQTIEELTIEPSVMRVDGKAHMKLKTDVQRSLPGRSVADYDLVHVDIRAYGEGRARLVVDGERQDTRDIRDDSVTRLINNGDSRGTWELSMSGDFDIGEMIVRLASRTTAGGDMAANPAADAARHPAAAGWELQRYCNCATGRRCYVRDDSGRRKVGACYSDCPNGCK